MNGVGVKTQQFAGIVFTPTLISNLDATICRFGDVVGYFTNKFMMGLRISGISIDLLPFAVLWAAVSISLGRDYRRQARALKDSGVS